MSTLAAFVEQERGAPFKALPDVVLSPADSFDQGTFNGSNGDDLFTALGFVPAGVSASAAISQSLGSHLLGRYTPDGKSGTITMRSGPITAYTRAVLVHELAHAWDDQHFNPTGASGDAALASTAVQEGSAMHTQHAWERSQPPEVQQAIDNERARWDERWRDTAPALRSLLLWPYVEGERFVDRIAGHDPSLHTAFQPIPTSSEQILHGRVPVGGTVHPTADEHETGRGLFNTAGLAVLLDHIGRGDLAFGWDAGEWVTWKSGTRTCARIDVILTAESVEPVSEALSAAGFSSTTDPAARRVSFSRCV